MQNRIIYSASNSNLINSFLFPYSIAFNSIIHYFSLPFQQLFDLEYFFVHILVLICHLICILCRDFTLGYSELRLGGGLPRYLVNRMINNECDSSTKHPTDDFLFLIFLCRFELLKLKISLTLPMPRLFFVRSTRMQRSLKTF